MPLPTSASEAGVRDPLFRLQHYSFGAPSLPVLRALCSTSSQQDDGLIPHAFVLISGLGDTLGTLPYIARLAHLLSTRVEKDGRAWELLLPTLSSTAGGYGTASLEGDARELGELVAFLRKEEKEEEEGGKQEQQQQGRRHIVIQGHSTGCQDLVQFLSEPRTGPFGVPSSSSSSSQGGSPLLHISAAILQAPVSDSEDFQHRVAGAGAAQHPSNKRAVEMLEMASKMVAEGRGHELLPRTHVAVLQPQHGAPAWYTGARGESIPSASDPISEAPITAYRFHSLHSPGGDDDFFSSPALLPDAALRTSRLAQAIAQAEKQDTRLLFLFSAQDQFVPEHLRADEGAIRRNFLERWEALQSDAGRAQGTVRGEVVPGADHAVHAEAAQELMLSHIDALLASLP
ncbi:hypothetical protein OC835_005226 [Tilletia horrida]|nr:hypothetical protein OC835_005226 [Tilletia horrida]